VTTSDPPSAPPTEPRLLSDLLADLPPAFDEDAFRSRLEAAVHEGARPLVVVDDDPTGTQTVSGARVLLDWDAAELGDALRVADPLFFLLTNSRSLPERQAAWLNEQIGRQLVEAPADVPFALVSRSDSTLRGHYPHEVLALQQGLGQTFDGHLLVPALFEAGRYTIGDVHWVAVPMPDSPSVVPASATPFARDTAFGYHSAHLPTWVQEKSRGLWSAAQVQSVSLDVVRAGPTEVCRRLQDVQGAVPVVVNAATYGDLASFVLGLLEAEARGKRFLYRTAASFVRVRAGLGPAPLLNAAQVYAACALGDRAAPAVRGGLVVVGSHVPASTSQLEQLLQETALGPIERIEADVPAILAGADVSLSARIDGALRRGALPVVYTSRELVSAGGDEGLVIGQRVTDTLVTAVGGLSTQPRFVVAKGGVTSHELARRGLGARRATALGQLLPGVPVWRLEAPLGALGAGIPYVVFPGNVGGPDDLRRVVALLSGRP
jgi:uncharacterized protein YgbK (DUF1537 family)